MKLNLKRYKNFGITCLLVFGWAAVMAQQNVTLYNMRSLPQRIYANPALRPDAKMFINVPGLSSHQINIGNTALNLRKLNTALEPNGDSNTLDFNKLAGLFNQRNLISFGHDIDLAHAGFKLGKNYFSINGTLKSSMKFEYPGDMFDLLILGNGGPNLDREFDLAFGIDMLQYFELGFGWSRDFLDDRLRLGARVKLLNGINNINTAKSQMDFSTASDDFTLSVKPDIEIRMASSILGISNSGFLGDSLGDPEIKTGSFVGFSNFGMGMDLGAVYEFSEKIHLSAAINNLGAIRWNSNTFILKSANPGQAVKYSGVNLDNLLDSSSIDFEDILQQLADTIGEQLNMDTSSGSYTTRLNPEFYLGANYNLTKNHNAAVLLYGNFYRKKLYPAATVSFNSRLTRFVSLSLTYSYMNRSFSNAGAGFSFSLGPSQWYIVSDNIFGVFKPSAQNSVNLRFGMNLTFRRKVKEGDA